MCVHVDVRGVGEREEESTFHKLDKGVVMFDHLSTYDELTACRTRSVWSSGVKSYTIDL